MVAHTYRLEHMLCISGTTIAVNMSYRTLIMGLVRTFEIRLFLIQKIFEGARLKHDITLPPFIQFEYNF